MPHVVMPLPKMSHLPSPAPTSHVEGTIQRTPEEEVDPALAWDRFLCRRGPGFQQQGLRVLGPSPTEEAGLPENIHSQDTRGHLEGADKGLTSVRTHTCVHAHAHTVPIPPPLSQVTPPWESWQRGQRTIWKEIAAPQQNAEPLTSRGARRPPAHTKDPHPSPTPAAPWPRPAPTSSLARPRLEAIIPAQLPASQAPLLLHFWVLHLCNGVRGFHLLLLQVLGPHVVHPVHQVHLEGSPLSALPVPRYPPPSWAPTPPSIPPPGRHRAAGAAGQGEEGAGVRGEDRGRGLPQSDA